MNLDNNYLKGAIDMAIANYEEGNGTIPAELGLEYTFQNGIQRPIGGENPSIDAVKITFTWQTRGEQKLIDSETDSYETDIIPMDDYFTILSSDSVSKLQSYVEDTLNIVTGRN